MVETATLQSGSYVPLIILILNISIYKYINGQTRHLRNEGQVPSPAKVELVLLSDYSVVQS